MSKQNIPNTKVSAIFELFLRDHAPTVNDKIKDWLHQNDPFFKIRGMTSDSAIWMKNASAATEIVIPKMTYSSDTPYFRGTDTTNLGRAPETTSMNVKHSGIRLKSKVIDGFYAVREIGEDYINHLTTDISEQMTKMHVGQAYNQLAKCFAQNAVYYAKKPTGTYQTDEFYYSMFVDAETGLIPFKANIPPFIPVCGLDTPNAALDVVSSDRCVFGGERLKPIPAGTYATIANAIAVEDFFGDDTKENINDDNSAILTVSHLQKMIRLARVGARVPGTEDPIYPLKTSTFNGSSAIGYAILISQDAYDGLRKTQEYRDQVNRAFREVSGQPSMFNGSQFVMQIGNTDVYVSDLLEHMQFDSPTQQIPAAKINYSVLMGKQAMIQLVSERQNIETWETVKNPNQDTFEIIYNEIVGYKPIRFSSKIASKSTTLVDRGLIHSFTISPQSLR